MQTVEGLADKDMLNRRQQAIRSHYALQCGFCTSGILMSMTNLRDENTTPTDDEITDILSGHLCRCTGYVGYVKAVQSLVQENITGENRETA